MNVPATISERPAAESADERRGTVAALDAVPVEPFVVGLRRFWRGRPLEDELGGSSRPGSRLRPSTRCFAFPAETPNPVRKRSDASLMERRREKARMFL